MDKKIFHLEGLKLSGSRFYRVAVRCVTIKDSKILMVYSAKNRDYKFPGGVLFYINEYRSDITRRVLLSNNYDCTLIDKAIEEVNKFDHEYYKNGNKIVTWKDEKKWLLKRTSKIVSIIDPNNEELVDKLLMLNFDTFQYKLFDETVPILERLKNRYNLYVLSNAEPSLDWAFDMLDFRKYFKDLFISSYLSMRKPSHEIYKYVLDKINCPSSKSLDDRIENIEAAKVLGFNVYHLNRSLGLTLSDFESTLE